MKKVTSNGVKKKTRVAAPKNRKPRVLVLGITGMLGGMVFRYLSEKGFSVAGTVRNKKIKKEGKIFVLDAEADKIDDAAFKKWKPDFVVNCIGIIKPYCKDDDSDGVLRAIRVNALFPYILSSLSEKYGFRTIQIATDCVYSGETGRYVESDIHDARDVYGKTKSLGEVKKGKFLNIRTSIIGPEEKGKLSLLEWFLAQKEGSTIKGFAHHRWNGVTVLQFAELVEKIINAGPHFFDELVSLSPIHHFVPNASVDKHELMHIFRDVFNKRIEIERVDDIGPAVDRTLATTLTALGPVETDTIRAALTRLVVYMT